MGHQKDTRGGGYASVVYCKPGRKLEGGSCYTYDELIIIVKAYNASLGKKKLEKLEKVEKLEKIKMTGKTKKQLWNEIKQRMRHCKNEICWIEDRSIDLLKMGSMNRLVTIREKAFKCPKPMNKWLRTNQITSVLKPYERMTASKGDNKSGRGKKGKFYFHGTFARDESMRSFKPKSLMRKGYDMFGFVYNMDAMHQPGSHWVALFIDARGSIPKIEYFDSVGDAPPKEIKKFMERVRTKDFGGKATVTVNKKVHQRGNNECGVYAMYYIINRVTGSSPLQINKNRIPDSMMTEYRNRYYYSGKKK